MRGCEHRAVGAGGGAAPRRSSATLIRSQFCSLPSRWAGTSDHVPRSRLPRSANGQLAVRLLLEQLVGALVPDLDAAGAVLALRDLAVEPRVARAGGPPRAPRAPCRPARAARPSGPPTTRAPRAAPAGSRSAAAVRRVAARRRCGRFRAGLPRLPANGSGVTVRVALAAVLAQGQRGITSRRPAYKHPAAAAEAAVSSYGPARRCRARRAGRSAPPSVCRRPDRRTTGRGRRPGQSACRGGHRLGSVTLAAVGHRSRTRTPRRQRMTS